MVKALASGDAGMMHTGSAGLMYLDLTAEASVIACCARMRGDTNAASPGVTRPCEAWRSARTPQVSKGLE